MVAVEPMGAGNPPRMTDEEWAELPKDDDGELVDGILVEDEEADWTHETAVVYLRLRLHEWAAPRKGFVAGSGLKYLLRPGLGRKADVSMILPGSKRPPARGILKKPADVLIEVIMPTPRDIRRDRIEKLREYAAFGVRYYWLLDPTLRTLEIYELNAEGRYVVALGAEAGKLENVPGCQGLRLDLDSLWAEIDGLADEESPDSDPQTE